MTRDRARMDEEVGGNDERTRRYKKGGMDDEEENDACVAKCDSLSRYDNV